MIYVLSQHNADDLRMTKGQYMAGVMSGKVKAPK